MKRLPPELLSLIFCHLAPPPPFQHRFDNLSSLCPLSLVNRQWRSVAQPLLFHQIRVTTEERGRMLNRTLESRPDLMECVRCLKMDVDAVVEATKALNACVYLESLHVWNVGVQAILDEVWEFKSNLKELHLCNLDVDLRALPSLPYLQSLTAERVHLAPHPELSFDETYIKFPSLRHISLMRCTGVADPAVFHATSIRTLDYHPASDKYNKVINTDLRPALKIIFPYLEALRFNLAWSTSAEVYRDYQRWLSDAKVLVRVEWKSSYLDTVVDSSIFERVHNLYLDHNGEYVHWTRYVTSISHEQDEALTKKLAEDTDEGEYARLKDVSFIYRIKNLKRVYLGPDLAKFNPVALSKSGKSGVEVVAVKSEEVAFKLFQESCGREKSQ